MRLQTRTWLVIAVLSLVGAAVFWRLGEQRLSNRQGRPDAPTATPPVPAGSATTPTSSFRARPGHATLMPARLRDAAGAAEEAIAVDSSRTSGPGPDGLRLRNTTRTSDELLRDDKVILLRNAIIDTTVGTNLSIPAHLRAASEPGSYILHLNGPMTPAIRRGLERAGIATVSYLPNASYLVRATSAQAAQLAGYAEVNAVLPYEPYFKIQATDLLSAAVRQEPLGKGMRLTVTLLPGMHGEGLAAMAKLGATVLSEFRTPFGPALVVEPAADSLAALAREPSIQGIEIHRDRALLNDLTRTRLGISQGTNAPGAFTNHLGLDGTNVFINVNDSGIDVFHPDLEGRVEGDGQVILIDTDGHGTHVAGTIAGNGRMSGTVSNAPGSALPGADYRGMAPAARLYALPIDLITGPLISDAYLQETAATNYYVTRGQTNLLLSNNSWGYIGAFEYTLSAASFDAAVRDALPEMPGAQPIAYVFAAGNEGFGREDGQGGEFSTVRSPGSGKNVITVGALEAPRNITNEVIYTDSEGQLQTNQVFLAETDSNFQITSFSSRGNIEPGVEGRYGRFKPDVVAPGAFIASLRSQDWTDPRSFGAAIVNRYENEVVSPGSLEHYALFVPPGADEFRIRILPNLRSPDPFPGLPLYLNYGDLADTGDLIGTNNLIRVPPDATLREGDWYYAVGNLTLNAVSYDLQTIITVTNDFGNYFEELKKLNDGLAPHYRYESGTSMSAPAVTGLLALFQDYFQREGRPTTPALLKALLINGARSVGSLYNFNVRDVINLQGWGLVNLTNAIPATPFGVQTGTVHAVQYIQQTGTNALITGQRRTWSLDVSTNALDQILKITLVWTDPPGNPGASIKLVNDLDLIVHEGTNRFFGGNDIPFRSDFTAPQTSEGSITNDTINNVENIIIRPPLSTNYLLSVRASRVNVNAVTEHPDGIAQDFALVVSVENTGLTNSLQVGSLVVTANQDAPRLLTPTNGVPLLSQRAAANPERLGTAPGLPSQWTFFVFTNLQQFTPETVGITNGSNVAFSTFLPPNLSRPRLGQADLDLYVSTNPQLTNLVPAVVNSAFRSARPGGSETIAFTNSTLGDVFYIGVKAEDQQAAEFGFIALSSNLPFDEDDGFGNRIVRGMPFRVAIPDGSPDQPQAGYVFGIATRSFTIQRVVATNTVSFDSTGDILANLSHNEGFVVLHNHALDPTGFGNIYTGVYDDSAGGNTSYGSVLSRPTDGPGSLTSFIGGDSAGLWLLGVSDNAITQTATNVALTLLITPEPDPEEYTFVTLQPGGCEERSVDVPANATNLVVDVVIVDPQLPVFAAVKRGSLPTTVDYDKAAQILPPGDSLALGRRDVPPLNAGRYYVVVCNPNAVPITVGIRIRVEVDLTANSDQSFGLSEPEAAPDDARRFSRIFVSDDREISDVRVGLRVDHPRVSDLVFHLTSPQGTRLLLSENRGGPGGTAYGSTEGVRRIFTTFTDETNLTTVPIKVGVAPFTNNAIASVASNRVVFADGFEAAFPRPYSAGETVAPDWVVTQGTAAVVLVPAGTTNVVEGVQYVAFDPATISGLATNVTLIPGRDYRLRYSLGRVAATAPQGLEIYVNGVLHRQFLSDLLTPGWYQESSVFTAPNSNASIEFRTLDPAGGRVPLALDAVSLEEGDTAFNAYYLPEEPLRQPLKGQRSLGTWTLEVTDTRAGPAGGVLGEFDWRLEFVFALPTIEAIELTNDVPYFGTVDGTDIRYFYIETPRCATTSLNLIAGEFATLLLVGDRDGLPIADLNTFPDDYGPYLNIEPGGIAAFVLTTAFPRSAPLRPGQRYYLAVRNFQPDITNNAFGILVHFDCEDPPFPVVPSLTNDVPHDATILPGPGLHYYQFVVSSNAIRADFELTSRSGGNVDMYIRRPQFNDAFPLPNPSNFDYRADDPDPAVTDIVTIDRVSAPEPLVPGIWFIAVRNSETVPVDYTIRVRETYATIVNLTNGVAFTNTIAPVDPFIGLLGADLQYYAFHVSSNSIRAQFETFGADGNVNLYVRQSLPIPTPFDFHFASMNPGILEEWVGVTNTATPIWLTPGWWFLSVENADVANVTYSIQATEFPAFIIPLTNNVAVTNVIRPGQELDYYSFPVSPEALSAKFEVYGMSDDVHLLLRQALPVPTFNDFTYASTNSGLDPESIELTPFSFPVGLNAGQWYLSVANASTNDATYVIRATEEVARVVVLTNAVPYNAAIQPGPDLDYYQFTVSSNASAAEFRLTSAGAGNLDLFLRKGPPLPAPANAHYASALAGVADEVIQIDTNSLPVPLSPGIWYLSVTNNEAFAVGYEITATEFVVEPPPISGQIIDRVITDTNICLTWISIPGTNYFVVAKTNALDAVWTPVSPTITAVDTNTTWCLAPPGPWRFFDVFEGDSPIHPIPNPVPVVRFDGDNICLSWASVPGTNYFVEAKRVFTDPDWILLTPSFPAVGTTTEICYPIDWGYRAFRVGVGVREAPIPVVLPPEVVDIESTVTSICITWPTQVGLDYLVEGKRRVGDVHWTVISEPYRGDGNPQTLCLDSATEFRFFRVIEGVSVPPGPPPSLPVPNIRWSLDPAFQLCIAWDTLLGAEYYVEGKVRLADPTWTVISPILTATGIELSYCQPLGAVWRYLRVNRVNSPPVLPVMIDSISLTPAGPVIAWTGPAGARYQVFYSDSILGQWQPVGGPVTSLDGSYEFLDDGSQSGPNTGLRFYRIERLP